MLDLIYSIILYPIIYIFPAYVANAVPVLFGKGARPIDFKWKMGGRRILGNNKTIRGTLSGIAAGIIVAYLESILFGMPYLFVIGIALSVGAMVGDLLGSFIKRRMDLQPGYGVPIMDQYGFFVVALIFAYPVDPSNAPTIYGLLFLVILTGVMHILTNMIAHRLKLKKVPW